MITNENYQYSSELSQSQNLSVNCLKNHVGELSSLLSVNCLDSFLARLHEVHRAIVVTSVVRVYVYVYVYVRVTLSVKVF